MKRYLFRSSVKRDTKRYKRPNNYPFRNREEIKKEPKDVFLPARDTLVITWDWLGLGDIDKYQNQFDSTMTQKAYVGVQFSDMNPAVRGMLFEDLGRRVFEKVFGKTGEPMEYYKSSKKGSKGKHDWSFDGKGIECKSSQLCYVKKGGTDFVWGYKWQSVKPHFFEKLVLVGYSPKKINFWIWDGKTGVGKPYNKDTNKSGFTITLQGKKNVDWRSFDQHPGHLFLTLLL